MPTATSFYPRIFALVVAAALGYALILIFAPFVGPLAWAAFLAFLLYPLNLRLRRRFPRQGDCGGCADGARAGHHPPAPERAVDRFRDADFGALAEAAKIRRRARHQIVFRSAAISLDRAHQRLAGGARGRFGGADSILAGFRHPRGSAARRQLERRFLSRRLGIAVRIRSHVVSAVLFPARRRWHAGSGAPPDSARR